jgi:hypothetical protein
MKERNRVDFGGAFLCLKCALMDIYARKKVPIPYSIEAVEVGRMIWLALKEGWE